MSSHPTPASSTPSSASGATPSGSSCPTPTFLDRVRGVAGQVADALLSVALAPACGVCGHVLEHPSHGAVCAACWHRCARFTPPLCARCGLPLDSVRVSGTGCGGETTVSPEPGAGSPEPVDVCPHCRLSPGSITTARAIGPHEGALRAIVHALKYDGLTSVAAPLATAMRRCGSDVLAGADALVPVPLHPLREWQRGFNQAEALSAHLGLPVRRVLCRRRPTLPQTSLSAAGRGRNVRDAFALAAFGAARGLAGWANLVARVRPVRAERVIRDRVLVLVDDVSTTGATLEACARVLVQNGAREVRALTAARAVLGPR